MDRLPAESRSLSPRSRLAGETKWNYWRLWNFALEGFTSFTIAPLKIATYLGVLIAGVAFAYAAFVIYKTLAFGDPARGYPSLMVVVLFLGAVQLVFIGVIGEYLGRMFDETKGRPLYFTKQILPPEGLQPRLEGRHGASRDRADVVSASGGRSSGAIAP